MITRRFLLLTVVLGLIGMPPARADDTTDRRALKEALVKLEKSSWEMAKKQDVPAIRAFYPDDLVLIPVDGTRTSKPDYLKAFPDFKIVTYTVTEKVDLTQITPDVATICYRVSYISLNKKTSEAPPQTDEM